MTNVQEQFRQEHDFSDPSGDDFEALSRDRIPVRSLTAADFEALVRIDKHITGQDRVGYYKRRVSEALEESGVRISLVAEQDGNVVGFIMARLDYGEFGRAASAAVIDTIGVDPGYRGKQVGAALMSQLLSNLAAFRVDLVRTEVEWSNFVLNRFLEQCGFQPAQRFAFSKKLD